MIIPDMSPLNLSEDEYYLRTGTVVLIILYYLSLYIINLYDVIQAFTCRGSDISNY